MGNIVPFNKSQNAFAGACAFCGSSHEKVSLMGPLGGPYICGGCVGLANEMIKEWEKDEKSDT